MKKAKKDLFIIILTALLVGVGLGYSWRMIQVKPAKPQQPAWTEPANWLPPSYFKHKTRNHLLKEKIWG